MTILRNNEKAMVYFDRAFTALERADGICKGKRGKRPLAAHLEENTATLVDTLRAVKDYCDEILNLLEEKV